MKLFKTAAILSLVALGIFLISMVMLIASGAGSLTTLFTGGMEQLPMLLASAGVAIVIMMIAMIIGLISTIFIIIGFFKLSDKLSLFKVVAILMIAGAVLGWVPVLSVLISIALIVIEGIAFLKLSKMTNDNNYKLYAISLFIAVLVIPIIFTMVMQYIVLFRLDKELEEKPKKAKA